MKLSQHDPEVGIKCNHCQGFHKPEDLTLLHNHYWDIYSQTIRSGDYWSECQCGHKQRLFIPFSQHRFGAVQKVSS